MFIAYSEDNEAQYVAQSGLNSENLPALKIKTTNGDKFAFLKTSGENLSKVKVIINGNNYFLQKINPICVAISGSSTFKLFTFLNGELQEVNTIFNGVAEQYQEIKRIQYIPEYGAYIVFLYTAGKTSSSGWHWFFQTGIYNQKLATFIGISFDGINFTFYPSALSDKTPPMFIFYNKKTLRLELGCYYDTGSRPVVNTDTCRILIYDIFNNQLTDNYNQSGISMISATVLETIKGNIYYANHEKYGEASYHFGEFGNWKTNKKEDFQIYYNQTLEKIYFQSGNTIYQLSDTENTTEDSLESCTEDEFYKSYGNINGYEVYSETQIYKDFNNKIDLGVTLYSLRPPSISYDPYTKSYVLVTKDSSSLYIEMTQNFIIYKTLYKISLSSVEYCCTTNISTSCTSDY